MTRKRSPHVCYLTCTILRSEATGVKRWHYEQAGINEIYHIIVTDGDLLVERQG